VLDAMDYMAHLSTDEETGDDAVVYSAGPARTRLMRQPTPGPPHVQTIAALSTVTVRAHKLNRSRQPFG
jgi:hypothetical protein